MTTPEIDRLIDRLKDKDPAVRRSAAEALGKLGPQAQHAAGALGRALRDEDPHVVFDAAFALGRIGAASVPVLVDSLNEKSADLRRRSLEAIRMIGHRAVDAVPAVAHQLATRRATSAATPPRPCAKSGARPRRPSPS